MRRYVKLGVCSGLLAVLAIAPAFGQNFTYTENFNNWPAMPNNGSGWTSGAIPIGWSTDNSLGGPGYLEVNPQVFIYDGVKTWEHCWGDVGGCWSTDWGTGIRPEALGQVDYTVPWSGQRNADGTGNLNTSGRLTLIHPNWDAGGHAASAWYTGQGETNYPLDLQHNGVKVAFDLSLRTGNPWCGHPADGGMFCIQPVPNWPDYNHYGTGGSQLSWGPSIGGFGVEVDIWPNTGDPSTSWWDRLGDSHMGVDVAAKWNPNYDSVPSLVDTGSTVGPFPWYLWQVGDNNQPIHVTVFYSHPDQGGEGVVRVYMYVDPATKYQGQAEDPNANPPRPYIAPDPQVPEGQLPFSFGMTTDDPPVPMNNGLGQLILETCVGPWTNAPAIFGFVASSGGCNEIFAIDNVAVETTPITAGSPCIPQPLDPGTAVELNAAAKVADNADDLSQPGWDVQLGRVFADTGPGVEGIKQGFALLRDLGIRDASATGVPDLNYADDVGSDFILPNGRMLPGYMQHGDHDWWGVLAKGYIYFPEPGDFSIAINSDNASQLTIGVGTPGEQIVIDNSATDGAWGAGLYAGTFVNLHVSAAGVYPIQLVMEERWGGGSVEMYRRYLGDTPTYVTKTLDELVKAIGTNSFGLTSQPLVYGLKSNAPAPDQISTWTAASLPVAAKLSPSEKIAGTGAGEQKFNLKIVQAPFQYVYDRWLASGPTREWRGVDELTETWCLRGLEYLADINGGAKSSTIYFNTNAAWPGNPYPGLPADASQFGLRADGYMTFPTAGTYYFRVIADLAVWIRFGNQTVAYLYYPDTIVPLEVPEAGTYPVRIEQWADGQPNCIGLFQLTANGAVLVNAPGSTVTVHESATTPATPPINREAHKVPANRKIANNGAGGILGFDGVLATHDGVRNWSSGKGIADVENNMFWVGPGGGPVATAIGTATPTILNFVDANDAWYPTMAVGHFGGDSVFEMFLKDDSTPVLGAGPADHFAMKATGYIEFPSAGYYLINAWADDSVEVWVAGQIVAGRTWLDWPYDVGAALLYVAEPGLYDFRVDFQEYDLGCTLEVFEYKPDGTAVLINDPASTLKVYRTLTSTLPNAPTMYHNPVSVPLSAKVGELNWGTKRGFNAQVAYASWSLPNQTVDGSSRGLGHDTYFGWGPAHELLAAAFDGVPSPNFAPVVVYDSIKATNPDPVLSRIAINPDDPGNGGPGWDWWPGFVGNRNPDFFAARFSAYLALKKGGHLFSFNCDDGAIVTIGGQEWRSGADKGSRWEDCAYFYIPEDGLYPFSIEFKELWGGNYLHLIEHPVANSPDGDEWEFVNDDNHHAWGNPAGAGPITPITTAYVAVCPTLWADADHDNDVDQADFGAFQNCFTGPIQVILSETCKCMDRGGTPGLITIEDLTEFMKCWTGPSATPFTTCP